LYLLKQCPIECAFALIIIGDFIMKTNKQAKKTRAQLERQILELNAQLASSYCYASQEISNASNDKFHCSGVLLQLTALGGREIIKPVVIVDGLSEATIAAIRADIKRSFDKVTGLGVAND
jgi:hypothetical protein